jgi:hypothetical protein
LKSFPTGLFFLLGSYSSCDKKYIELTGLKRYIPYKLKYLLKVIFEFGALMETSYPEMAERFGIWRVHNHFEMGEDEVLHETSDPKTKESTLRIIPKANLPQGAFASTWRLTAHGPVVAAWCCDHSSTTRPTR